MTKGSLSRDVVVTVPHLRERVMVRSGSLLKIYVNLSHVDGELRERDREVQLIAHRATPDLAVLLCVHRMLRCLMRQVPLTVLRTTWITLWRTCISTILYLGISIWITTEI